jgi:hypothetical protein
METKKSKKVWIAFQGKIMVLFYLSLIGLIVSDFFIQRHHHFKIGETYLFEAFAGIAFIVILAFLSIIFKLLFFKT